jgi:hypothetical protein
VIYGLQNRPEVQEVKDDLIKKNINCKTVYVMKTKSPLYVVITDNKTTLNDLQEKARTVQQVVVTWKKTNEQKGDNPVPQLSVMGTLRRELLRQNKVFKMCRDTPDQ